MTILNTIYRDLIIKDDNKIKRFNIMLNLSPDDEERNTSKFEIYEIKDSFFPFINKYKKEFYNIIEKTNDNINFNFNKINILFICDAIKDYENILRGFVGFNIDKYYYICTNKNNFIHKCCLNKIQLKYFESFDYVTIGKLTDIGVNLSNEIKNYSIENYGFG